MKQSCKQFLVLGLGRFGTSLARHLCQLGHEVLAVDHRRDLVEDAAPFVTQAVQANATDEDALAALGVSHFDAAIVAIGQNIRDSILVSVLCKEKGVPLVMAKAVDELHAKVLEKVGVDRVIFPEQDMGLRVARQLTTPNMLDMIDLTDGYQMVDLAVPECWIGRSLMEVNVRRDFGLSIIGLHRGGRFLPSPGAKEIFCSGDTMIVLGRKQDIDDLEPIYSAEENRYKKG